MKRSIRLAGAVALLIAGSALPASAFTDRNCSDFAYQEDAQAFFIAEGGPTSDPHRLDSNGDGVACESLPHRPPAKIYPTATARAIEDTCAEHQAGRFSDTAGTAHAYTIDCVAGWNITSGKTPTTFEPGGTLSRGQTATFLVRTLEAAGVPVPAAADTCSETDVHAVNVERLIAAAVVPAPADRRCLTSQPITRDVMASWTRGALALAGIGTSDTTDWYGDDGTSSYQAAINQITSLGIVTGKGGGLYGPTETLTRGQMATFLARTLDALLTVA